MNTEPTSITRLQGPPLWVGRFACIAVGLAGLVLFIVSIPLRLASLSVLAPMESEFIEKFIGISVNSYVIYKINWEFLVLAGFYSAGVIIFISRSDDWMALLVSAALFTLGFSIIPTPEALVAYRPAWQPMVTLINGLGAALTLLVLYLFPNGRFIPRWTSYLTLIFGGWLLSWLLLPYHTLELDTMSAPVKFLTYILSSDPEMLPKLVLRLRELGRNIVLLAWFGSGIFAQIYRYKKIFTSAEKLQVKWVVLGILIAFIGYFAYTLPLNLPLRELAAMRSPGVVHLVYENLAQPVYFIALLMVPLTIVVSISLFHLWDIDLLINRAIVYSMLTALVSLGYIAIVFLIQLVFGSLTGTQSTLVIILSTLILATLTRPLHGKIQDFIDQHFYREKIDARKAFTDFSRQVRTIIELPDLLHILIDRTSSLLHIHYAAVYLYQPDHSFMLAESSDLPAGEYGFIPNGTELTMLLDGKSVVLSKHDRFQLLVPLTALRAGGNSNELTPYLVGVLALGPRLSGLGYTRGDRDLLLGLADQAGTAIYVAQLIRDKDLEEQRREEAERHLEEHFNSPAGRAELLALELSRHPPASLTQIHSLAGLATTDPLTAAILASLPNALKNLAGAQDAPSTDTSRALTGLAEGYLYLFNGLATPELVPVGLRTLISHMLSPAVKGWEGIEDSLQVYQNCYQAQEANSIPQITDEKGFLKPSGQKAGDTWLLNPIDSPFLQELTLGLAQFEGAINALKSFERVETLQDKLAYLANAVERLHHVERYARTELKGTDRALMRTISETWLGIITGTISDLQTRARLVCQLLTRHTWQEDVVSVGLSVSNQGHGAALNLRISLTPDPNYTLLDGGAQVEKLNYGEEIQVYLRLRPHIDLGENQFRVRFIVLYNDPRGPDQVENFADVVQLMATSGDFQFIPNPYVVGTPLQTGSPLFYGRHDLIDYVKENLAASHRNNLVLIGQRRTGKTSFLKQLPAHLGEEYLPVYLDGQALGLDPGLPNFFLSLATEISFAMEDRGFTITQPEFKDFINSPAAVFERDFLNQVRAQVGDRHLLIMLDEFEELETAVRRGDLEASIFGFLRHLIQHSPNLSIIFCGTHRLEELASDYWNVLFNISIYRHISFLEKEDAMHLVQDPVSSYGMRYDDLALDKIWRVTAGHPYFMQLLCHNMVNQHNRTQRSYVTIADVNAAMDEILASGEAHFVYLWAESSPVERVVLTTTSRLVPLTGQVTSVQVVDYLHDRGVSIEREEVSAAFHHLALRDVLTAADSGEAYRWRLGLLGMWVEKYKSMSRTIDDLK